MIFIREFGQEFLYSQMAATNHSGTETHLQLQELMLEELFTYVQYVCVMT